MNFEYIQDFIRVAEYNSINKASQELNISTPALSKRIKSVEAYFNCHLFYRTSKGIFLNEEGKLVFNTFREMQHSIADLKKQLNISFDSKWKIGVIPSFSLTNKYKNRGFDEIASLIIEDSTSILIEELSKGNIDLLIGDVSKLNNRDIYRKRLYSEDFMVIYNDDNKFTESSKIEINELLSEKIYIQNPPCDTYDFIKNRSMEDKLNLNYNKHFESVIANIKAGNGITLMPVSLTSRISNMNLFQKVLSGYKRDIGIASYDQRKIIKIYDFLLKNLEEERNQK